MAQTYAERIAAINGAAPKKANTIIGKVVAFSDKIAVETTAQVAVRYDTFSPRVDARKLEILNELFPSSK